MDLRQIALLLVFFICYVIFGGLIFMQIEAPHEMDNKLHLRESTEEFKG